MVGLWPTLRSVQLENALLNLCINARDAMPEGGVTHHRDGQSWIDERGGQRHGHARGAICLDLRVRHGTGMPPDVIAHAFDPFFTTKPIGQGTGLGLSMIYGFAKQSRDRRGSTRRSAGARWSDLPAAASRFES